MPPWRGDAQRVCGGLRGDQLLIQRSAPIHPGMLRPSVPGWGPVRLGDARGGWGLTDVDGQCASQIIIPQFVPNRLVGGGTSNGNGGPLGHAAKREDEAGGVDHLGGALK